MSTVSAGRPPALAGECVGSGGQPAELGSAKSSVVSLPASDSAPVDAKGKTSQGVQKAPPVSAAKAPRLDALDAPRWFASCMIVGYHFYREELGRFGQWGSAWTQFFFVLSGFILGYVEMARPAEKSPKLSQLQYLRRRLVTMYPTYIFALICQGLTMGGGHTWFKMAVLPMHILMVQAWLPICGPEGEACAHQSWNGVAWFMSVLVVYWLLLRPLARWARSLSLRKAYAVSALLWLWSLLFRPLQGAGSMGICTDYCYRLLWTALQGGPLGYLHVFACGVVAARIFVLSAMSDAKTGAPPNHSTQKLALDVDRAPFVLKYGCCIGYAAYALCILILPYGHTYFYLTFHNGGILPVMLLVLLGGAIGVDPITKYVFRNPVLIVCGRISFNQYLFQETVWYILKEHMPPEQELLRKCIYPVVLLTLAYISERFVTSPYTEWQRLRQERGIKGADDWLIGRADRMLDTVPKFVGCRRCMCCRRRDTATDITATEPTMV